VGGARAAHRYLLVGLLVAAAGGYFLDMEKELSGSTRAQPGDSRPARSDAGPEPRDDRRAAGEHHRRLALTLERALASGDAARREAAFHSVLPVLMEAAPARVVAVLARTEPGEIRDALRDEMVRSWMSRDREAAIAWLHSLSDDAERHAGATIAVHTLAARSPARAIEIADAFGVGHDDGSLEHLVQAWAAENPQDALRWLEARPDGPGVAQLRARIEHILAQRSALQP
jgi:hypothetical protein